MGSSNNRADNFLFLKQITIAREGNAQQRAELLESFRNYLRVIAINEIGPETNGKLSVSDIVQETIIGAFDGIEGCRASSEAEFKSWLRQVLVHELSNRHHYLRRQKRDINNEVPVEAIHGVAPEVDDPVAQILLFEQRQELDSSIETLNADHQRGIRLKHQERLSFREIAQKWLAQVTQFGCCGIGQWVN